MTEHRLSLPFLPLSVNDSLRPAKLAGGQVRLVSTREAERNKAAIRELAAFLQPLPIAPLEVQLTVWVPTLAHGRQQPREGAHRRAQGARARGRQVRGPVAHREAH
jgi:hypothetical protein